MPPEPTADLAALAREHFMPHLGGKFRMDFAPGQSAELELIEAKALGQSGHRAAFSLLFRAADVHFFVPQNTYTLTHPQLGPLDIFLVPVGPDAVGMRFEAVFA